MNTCYTLKHGNWLNIAEIKLNVMTRQCLKRRIPNIDILSAELTLGEAYGIGEKEPEVGSLRQQM